MRLNFYIYAVAALGKGLSGGDRIFIELSKRWSKANNVFVYVWQEGYEMCKREGLGNNVTFKIVNVSPWCNFGFLICYFARIISSIWTASFIKINDPEQTIIYSASEFWMDSLPAFILKMRFPKVRWVACWFQTAPNPIKGFKEAKREKSYKLSALYYWLMQLPIKPLIKIFADLVLVNNEYERKQFKQLDEKNKVFVFFGAVDTKKIEQYHQKIGSVKKEFDAVFQGRFHPQKGVMELIDIWKKVVTSFPGAKLAMIGDGPLMTEVREKIRQLKLEDNIKLLGFVFDGIQKYQTFAKSKLVVHPAFFDSGGMASAEAMAFGIPCVGFNLQSYDSYYPKGMVKVETGDLNKFADAICTLISDKEKRERLGNEAREMVMNSWDWEKRVHQLMQALDN